MKILFYLGLNRIGQKEEKVIDLTDYEVDEWINFGIQQGYEVDETQPLQKQVQKIVDATYADQYNADRREHYNTVKEVITYDKEGNALSSIDLIADESSNMLDQMVEQEDEETLDKIEQEFLSGLTETQLRRLKLYKEHKNIKKVAEIEGVHHSSISETIKQLKTKYEEIRKKYLN